MNQLKQRSVVSSLLLFLFASVLSAATFVVPSDRVLVQKSDAVIRGTVLTSHAEALASGGIVTITDVSVSEVLKGTTGRVVHVYAPGGVVGERAMIIPGAAHFSPGEEVLLMLNGSEARGWGVTDLALGRFGFASDIEGHKLAVRAETEISGWELSGDVHRERRRSADKFVQFVRDVVAGRPAAENYIVPSSPLHVESLAHRVAADMTTTPTSYTLGNESNADRGYRWPAFLPAAAIWHEQNSPSSSASNGVQAAISTWTTAPFGVAYSYGVADSTATATLATPDTKNAVHYNVNMNTLFYGNLSPFSCATYGGLIAMGGITNASGAHAHPVSGEAFYSTVEADVDVNSGVESCSAFLASSAWTAAMTHELGHTLGFRHSNEDRVGGNCALADLDCATASVMSYPLSGATTLQTWDTHALQAVYPCTGTKSQDFNHDCKSDIVVRNSSTGDVVRWLVSGSVVTNGAVAMTGVSGWTVAATGDYNGDGYADLVFRNSTNGDVKVVLMNNSSVLSSSVVSSPGLAWVPLASGDVNGDGKSDIVLQNSTTGDVAVWLMNGFTVTGGVVGSSTAYKVKFVGDTDGDGNADIVLQDDSTGYVVVWKMSGFTLVSGAIVGTPAPAWQVKAVGDCDGDGKADILLRNTSTGEVAEWQMNGLTLVSGAIIGTPTPHFDVLGAADYNGDGRADLLLQCTYATATDCTPGDVAEWQLFGMSIAWGGAINSPGFVWQAIVR
jgi:hypothetical protein